MPKGVTHRCKKLCRLTGRLREMQTTKKRALIRAPVTNKTATIHSSVLSVKYKSESIAFQQLSLPTGSSEISAASRITSLADIRRWAAPRLRVMFT